MLVEADFDMAEFNRRRANYGRNAAIHEDNLAALGGLMISSGLFPVPTPMLAFGTLLGYVRAGRCIEGDHDADVILPHDTDMGKILCHREKFGFKICRVATDLFSLERNNQYVDIYLARPRTATDTWIAQYYAISNDRYDNPTRVEWLCRTWLIPSDPEGYLAKVYGEDWRVPREGCHAQP